MKSAIARAELFGCFFMGGLGVFFCSVPYKRKKSGAFQKSEKIFEDHGLHAFVRRLLRAGTDLTDVERAEMEAACPQAVLGRRGVRFLQLQNSEHQVVNDRPTAKYSRSVHEEIA